MGEWHETEIDAPELTPLIREATREFHWPAPSRNGADEEAWLYHDDRGAAVGFAIFRCIPSYDVGRDDDWELTHVWLRPPLRRRGALRAAWRGWRKRYGRFELFEPNPGMEAAARALSARRRRST